MQALILARSLAFTKELEDLVDSLEEEEEALSGRYRPGGRIDLNELGDDIWQDQFRCVSFHWRNVQGLNSSYPDSRIHR
jgi:hypothetical protein